MSIETILDISIKSKKDYWKIPRGYLFILLVGAGPLLLAILASYIAGSVGCELNEAGSHDCLVGEVNIGSILNFLFTLGWLSMLTIPIGIGFIVAWTINSFKAVRVFKRSMR